MAWAVDQELPALQKLVLLMLANHTNGHTGRCDPSLKRLAVECGMSRDSIIRNIKRLEQSNTLSVIREKDGDINKRNYYILRIPGVVADSDQGSSTQRLGVVADSDPKQEVKPVIKTTPLPPTLKPQELPDWLDAEVWDSFVKFRKEIKSPLSVHAAELALRKLDRLRKEGQDPTQVIEQSILSGWKGLFSSDDRRAPSVEQWWRSNAGIDAKGREIGLNARGGENYENYKTRIFEELKVRT